jgi:hypothetical protein
VLEESEMEHQDAPLDAVVDGDEDDVAERPVDVATSSADPGQQYVNRSTSMTASTVSSQSAGDVGEDLDVDSVDSRDNLSDTSVSDYSEPATDPGGFSVDAVLDGLADVDDDASGRSHSPACTDGPEEWPALPASARFHAGVAAWEQLHLSLPQSVSVRTSPILLQSCSRARFSCETPGGGRGKHHFPFIWQRNI